MTQVSRPSSSWHTKQHPPQRDRLSMQSDTMSARPITVVDAGPTTSLFVFRELVQYRELLYFLVWRNLKVRYKQTFLGIAWAVIQPLFLALTLSLFLGRLAHVPSDGVPYPVFAYSGMVAWQLFAQALTESSGSLVANERLITKVYFPRLVIPMSAVAESLVDFAIASCLLVPFLAYYRIAPTAAVLTLPLFAL